MDWRKRKETEKQINVHIIAISTIGLLSKQNWQNNNHLRAHTEGVGGEGGVWGGCLCWLTSSILFGSEANKSKGKQTIASLNVTRLKKG